VVIGFFFNPTRLYKKMTYLPFFKKKLQNETKKKTRAAAEHAIKPLRSDALLLHTHKKKTGYFLMVVLVSTRNGSSSCCNCGGVVVPGESCGETPPRIAAVVDGVTLTATYSSRCRRWLAA